MLRKLLGGNSYLFRFAKGLKYWYNDYVKSLDRRHFGQIDDSVHLAPPLQFSNPANIYLEGHNALRNAIIFQLTHDL